MARMPEAFKAAISGVANPPIVPVVEVGWPSGTGYYSSESFQRYDPRVAEAGIGNVQTTVSERPSDLSFQTTEVNLIDTDAAITLLLNGPRDPRRSTVLIRWAHPGLSSSDWFTVFSGILDEWEFSPGVVSLRCKTDDVALSGFVPKVPMLSGSIPGLIEQSRGIYAPIIYGIHDDQSLEGKGAIKCIPVDAPAGTATANHYWVVGVGILGAVARVRQNAGAALSSPSNYEVKYPVWGGSTYTAIYLKDNNKREDEITCDVEGLTSTGGATGGAVILSAAEQLRHFLANFVWGDWRTGSWRSDPQVLEADSFASAGEFLSKYGGEGSLFVGGTTQQARAVDIVNKWLKSQPMVRARWSNTGRLGLRVINHASGDYLSDPWIQQERDELSPMRYGATASQLVSRVSLSYLPGARAGKMWQSMDLQDLELWSAEKSTEQLRLECSAARFQ